MRKQLTNAVKEVQGGKKEAFALLYEEFKQPAYFRAVNIVGEIAEAEDIVQEAFITAFQRIGDLRNPETFPSWLNKITVSKCADYLRKQQRLAAAAEELGDTITGEFEQETDESLIPDTAAANAETARIIYEIIQQLPLPQRACIYFFYYERLTISEITEELSVNENTVKSRLALAREKIRAELERREDEEGLKLYNTIPLLLIPIMKIAAKNTALPPILAGTTATTIISTAGTASTVTASTAGTAATATSSTAGTAATATKAAFSVKAIIAAVVGVVVVTGGIIAGVSFASPKKEAANTVLTAYMPVSADDSSILAWEYWKKDIQKGIKSQSFAEISNDGTYTVSLELEKGAENVNYLSLEFSGFKDGEPNIEVEINSFSVDGVLNERAFKPVFHTINFEYGNIPDTSRKAVDIYNEWVYGRESEDYLQANSSLNGKTKFEVTFTVSGISSAADSKTPAANTAAPIGEVIVDLSYQGITDEILAEKVANGEIPKNVTSLSLNNNLISNTSPLKGLTDLEFLTLSYNKIDDISDLKGLTSLNSLHFRDNQISDSDISILSELKNLSVLSLDMNNISDISVLSGLTKLTNLYLESNQISDISALSGLTNITVLSLGNNKINDISPLKNLTKLNQLWLFNTQIKQEQIAELQSALPNCDIDYLDR